MTRRGRLFVVGAAVYLVVASSALIAVGDQKFGAEWGAAWKICYDQERPDVSAPFTPDVKARIDACMVPSEREYRTMESKLLWQAPLMALWYGVLIVALVAIVLGALRWIRAGKP